MDLIQRPEGVCVDRADNPRTPPVNRRFGYCQTSRLALRLLEARDELRCRDHEFSDTACHNESFGFRRVGWRSQKSLRLVLSEQRSQELGRVTANEFAHC